MWYYAENNEQRGPVSEADFSALVQAGTVKDETLVWREGMANWQPWREVKPAAGGLLCASCGKSFPPAQVVHVGDRWLCTACQAAPPSGTPAVFATGASFSGAATEAQVRDRDYTHDIGGYAGQAWELVKSDFGSIVGASALVFLCVVAANAIPYLSMVTGIIFTGPLYGGLFLFFLKKIRRQDAALGDAFGGFGPRFGQLLVGHLVPSLLAALAFIPAIVIFVAALVLGGFGKSTPSDLHKLALTAPLLAAIGLGVVGVAIAIYLQTCWIFTLWLVADKNYSFWPAMSLSRAVVSKHWWQTFLLGIIAGLVAMLGILLCLVGVLFTGPMAVAMYAYAYEKLFSDLQPGN